MANTARSWPLLGPMLPGVDLKGLDLEIRTVPLPDTVYRVARKHAATTASQELKFVDLVDLQTRTALRAPSST